MWVKQKAHLEGPNLEEDGVAGAVFGVHHTRFRGLPILRAGGEVSRLKSDGPQRMRVIKTVYLARDREESIVRSALARPYESAPQFGELVIQGLAPEVQTAHGEVDDLLGHWTPE